jgi:hypothetical protein
MLPPPDQRAAIVKAHLDALATLLLLPLPALVVVATGLLSAEASIEVMGFAMPRSLAEVAVRLAIILLICAMAAHADAIQRLLGADPQPELVAILDWHPGTANPFRLHPRRLAHWTAGLLLAPRLIAGPFTAGFVLGTAFNFRTAAAPVVMTQYCNVAAWLVRPFDFRLAHYLEAEAARWSAVRDGLGQFLTWADYGLLALMMLAMAAFFGTAGAVYDRLKLVDGHDGRFNLMITGFFAGMIVALVVSALAIAG